MIVGLPPSPGNATGAPSAWPGYRIPWVW